MVFSCYFHISIINNVWLVILKNCNLSQHLAIKSIFMRNCLIIHGKTQVKILIYIWNHCWMNSNYYGWKASWCMMLLDHMKANFDCELCCFLRSTIILAFLLFQVYALHSKLSFLHIYIYIILYICSWYALRFYTFKQLFFI